GRDLHRCPGRPPVDAPGNPHCGVHGHSSHQYEGGVLRYDHRPHGGRQAGRALVQRRHDAPAPAARGGAPATDMSTLPALSQQQRTGPPRLDGATLATGCLVVVVAGLAWVGVAHPTSWMAAGGSAGVLAGAVPYLLGWGVVMAAMMLPSPAPPVALYTGMRRNAARAGNRGVG